MDLYLIFRALAKLPAEQVKLGIYRLSYESEWLTLWATENPEDMRWDYDDSRSLFLVAKVGHEGSFGAVRQDEVRAALSALAVLALCPPNLVRGGRITAYLRRMGYAHRTPSAADFAAMAEMGWTSDQVSVELQAGARCPDLFGPSL